MCLSIDIPEVPELPAPLSYRLPALPDLPDLPLPLPCCKLPPIEIPLELPAEIKAALALAVSISPPAIVNVFLDALRTARKKIVDFIALIPLECPKEL